MGFSVFDEKTWKIGGMIHFEPQSSDDYIGAIELNRLTRKTLKQFFEVKSDTCAETAKVLIRKIENNYVITHRESSSRPGVGEDLHATLIYTRKRVKNGHETLKDTYSNLKEVDNSLPTEHPPTLKQVANAYHKIIEPNWKFKIDDVVFFSGKTATAIVVKLLFEDKDYIFNKNGKPISGNFLHIGLVVADPSVAGEKEKFEAITSILKKKLLGKYVKVGNINGQADLEFGVSGTKERLRPT